MQANRQAQNSEINFEEHGFETIASADCLQVREKLTELLSGASLLEETPAVMKRSLFVHLETCRECCRWFDASVRFHPASRGGDGIY